MFPPSSRSSARRSSLSHVTRPGTGRTRSIIGEVVFSAAVRASSVRDRKQLILFTLGPRVGLCVGLGREAQFYGTAPVRSQQQQPLVAATEKPREAGSRLRRRRAAPVRSFVGSRLGLLAFRRVSAGSWIDWRPQIDGPVAFSTSPGDQSGEPRDALEPSWSDAVISLVRCPSFGPFECANLHVPSGPLQLVAVDVLLVRSAAKRHLVPPCPSSLSFLSLFVSLFLSLPSSPPS